MITYAGLALYYASRTVQLMLNYIWRFSLGAHLKVNSMRCGSIRVNGYGRFVNIGGLSIGQNVHVNFGANWMCDGGLYIGDNVHISSNCTIYTRNHNSRGKALPYDEENITRPVYIGKNTWIGVNVTIVPGARIGEGVIIGAGSVVHGNIPDYSIVGAGAPVVIGERDLEHYTLLETAKAYGGANGRLVRNQLR